MKVGLIIFTILFLLQISVVKAQNIDVKSFRKLRDSDARISYPKEDQNGEKCAIVKISTTETGFKFEGDATGITDVIRKTGEYWVYVSEGAKRLVIKHNKLGVKRYVYSEPIRMATSYELILHLGIIKTTIIDADLTEFLVFESTPSDADVYIDNKFKGTTPFQAEIRFGEHSYRIEKDLYHNESGILEIKKGKGINKKIELRPNFGYLEIASSPEIGASISINGEETDLVTPAKTERLKPGIYKVTVRKKLYSTTTKEFEVRDGEATESIIKMKSKFGSLMINSEPSGAEIYLDGKSIKQTTPFTMTRLLGGEHTIKVRKPLYTPSKKDIIIKDGVDEEIIIVMKPTFGSCKVLTLPDAEIFINDKFKSRGEFTGKLVAGDYVVEARKKHYYTVKKTIKLNVGDTRELSLTPTPIFGSLKVISQPLGADVFIDKDNLGKTPLKIRQLLEGEYSLKISKKDYGIVDEIIKISENKTTTIDKKLTQAQSVSIISVPNNADVYIDSKFKGKTPFDTFLTHGEYFIKVEKDGQYATRTINITKNGGNIFEFDIVGFKDVLIKSSPVSGTIYVDEKKEGVTGDDGKVLKLKYGNHSIKVVNNNQSVKKTIRVKKNMDDSYTFNLLNPKRYYLVSNSTASAPYGFQFGRTGGVGFYISSVMSKISFDSPFEYELEIDAVSLKGFDTKNAYYYKSNNKNAYRFSYSFTAGLTTSFGSKLTMYYGMGYGVNHKLYNFDTYYYDGSFRDVMVVKDIKSSREGVTGELGIIFKIRKVVFSVGMLTIVNETNEADEKTTEYNSEIELKFGLGFYL